MKTVNHTYAYGMLILGIICFLSGFSTIKMNPGSPFGLGTVFMGLFLGIQYLKAVGRTAPHVIRMLTWIVVFGFFVADILLLYDWIKGRL